MGKKNCDAKNHFSNTEKKIENAGSWLFKICCALPKHSWRRVKLVKDALLN